ncbi:MAG TPA: bacillithiol biosynthesis cysteine-adding enzyme BshC [Chitinophagaceae bacterium]|nr:bacillithiol biosynthesis cysteine-adding enzyme BshC [Chitinophagaceae bacterium]
MNCTSTRLPYRQTGAFSKIALDYIDQAAALKPFFAHPPSLQGIQKAIDIRKKFATNREVLVQELKKQYSGVETSDKVRKNIESLLSADTFTITTAHQNNIFTGPLYFIYKIVHAIKLADHLKASLPKQNFVPVFYIGTEDADLEELNHIHLGGEKLVWETKQTGAVGRMKVDKGLVKLIEKMQGQLSVLPNGNEIISRLKEYYKEGTTIQDATFRFVNNLFAEYGLVVLLPDNAALKQQMVKIFEDDLLNQTASEIVEKTAERLAGKGYKIQANPREINLFYLPDDKRERIIKQGTRYKAQGTSLDMSEEELKAELRNHPECFSPNVILRGLYQETILPNIAFIGGAGETAYWLQLKDLFEHYKIPFPVLVLRNSFLIVEKKWKEKINHLGFTAEDFFLPEQELMNRLVAKESKNETKLNGPLTEVEQLYEVFKKQAKTVDGTLEKHVDALKLQTVHRLQELEKKMLRAEKRKFADQQRQIHTIQGHLFPANGLQERYENLSYYYAKWGREFIQKLHEHSLGLEQEFVVIMEK